MEEGDPAGWRKRDRLYPLTAAVNKHLLPVYDKPLIYYSLSILMMAGVRDVLLISNPGDLGSFEKLLGDGSRLGLRLHYESQPSPKGIGDAFIVGSDFIGDDSVALVLGDNFIHGDGIEGLLRRAANVKTGAVIFAYEVEDPKGYGVVELDPTGRPLRLEEKPASPKTSYAVPGVYFYDNQVVDIASQLTPSARGELEITDVNREYLRRGQLQVEVLGNDFTWFDTGTPESLQQASAFVQTAQQSGRMIACPEEIAWRCGYASRDELAKRLDATSTYGQHVLDLLSE